MHLTFKNKMLFTTALVALTLGGVGIYHAQAKTETPAAAQAPQAMPVETEVIQAEPVQIWKDFSGRLKAVDYAEIRPQVSGTVTEIRFQDGQDVKAGDILYVIDPRTYQAAVEQAESELNAARNQQSLAEKEIKRAESLIKTAAISQSLYDSRLSAARVAKAAVATAQAKLDQAKINLDYAYVKAPISGRVSRAEITKGNLVGAGPNAPLLTAIVSNEGIYVDFEVDEQTYLTYVRGVAHGLSEETKIPVKLTISGDAHEYDGFIQSFDNKIDVSSGTIRARALLDNKDYALLPGMFASVKMGAPTSTNRILVSERAIGTDQDRKFVYTVTPENKVAYQTVEIGDSVDGKKVIMSGLKDGDRIITDGIIRIRPDMVVAPQEKKTAALAAPVPADAATAVAPETVKPEESAPETAATEPATTEPAAAATDTPDDLADTVITDKPKE